MPSGEILEIDRQSDDCENSHIREQIDSLIHEYARRYSANDAEAVTELCVFPFLAIRGGIPIHLSDHDAVRDHFAAMMLTYRGAGAARWSPVAIDTHELGAHAAFVSVRWNALNSDGGVIRDTTTTYHLLADPSGWHFLSYTNHF